MLRLRGQSKRDLGERVEMPSPIDDGSDLAWRAGTVERRLHWLQLTNPAPRLPRAESGSGSALRDDEMTKMTCFTLPEVRYGQANPRTI